MADTLKFELVTPAELAISTEAYMVVAPGKEGEVGILAHHMPFVTTLKAGVLTIYEDDDTAENARGVGGAAARKTKYFITGGVAEVAPEKGLTILAEKVIDLGKLTRADVESRLGHARNQLSAAVTDEQKRTAQTEVDTAEALLAVVA